MLGFPCDQFGDQEPGDEAEIASFCERNFGVTFPMFAKVDVNGDEAHPLFQWLRDGEVRPARRRGIKWNFTKFLIGRDGEVINRFSPTTEPTKLADQIEAALCLRVGAAGLLGQPVRGRTSPATLSGTSSTYSGCR